MDNGMFITLCKVSVKDYYLNEFNSLLGSDDIYVVWSCKTLQNNKALLSTNIVDGMYFEVTYNGDKNELYLDAYKKQLNKCIKLKGGKHSE